jgi:peptide-methionine (S)-S-oxide reductase
MILLGLVFTASVFAAVKIADPALDEPRSEVKGERVAVLAGGCFWGVEAVFESVKGVIDVHSGYSGGSKSSAEYELVSTGRTAHAEAVQIRYDPSVITYGQLLKIFFSVAHNPTELNRQGPDEGTQYRSVIFAATEEQERIAKAYIAQLNQAKAFRHRVVTQVSRLNGFYIAEDYHQDFVARNPNNPYVMLHDLRKLSDLQKHFPDIYIARKK